jgi:UPF0755 protein
MPTRTRRHPLARIAALIAALAVIAAGALAIAFVVLAAPAGGEGGIFTVERGDSATVIAAALEERGFIRSALAFKLLARIEGEGASLQAGSYRIEPSMGAREILRLFVSGRQAMTRVTVPEGFTLSQIARLLQELGVTGYDDFLAAARSRPLLAELGIPGDSSEGYLFPDTYFFSSDFPADKVVRAMAGAFFKRLAAMPETASLSPGELRERIILASIVEREYKDAEEAPLMASVFYNRVKIGMALQSCATVVYVITERQGKPHPEVILDRDLKIADPYNTYAQRGLPPGPISNPGMTALDAAFRPAKTPYLYFRLTDAAAGRHHFSETLEEHIDARKLYIKGVGR